MPKKLVKQLQEALAGSGEDFAAYYGAVASDPQAEVERLDTPFLNDYGIVAIERATAKKHTLLYLGFGPGRELYPLTGKPENFSRLALADGVSITSLEEAGEYVDAYLQVTARAGELFYLVNSVDEVMFRPNLDEDEARQRAAFAEANRPLIGPALVETAGDGYQVSLYAVREQALERHMITVSRAGEIEHTVVVLEEDLPLVYGGRV